MIHTIRYGSNDIHFFNKGHYFIHSSLHSSCEQSYYYGHLKEHSVSFWGVQLTVPLTSKHVRSALNVYSSWFLEPSDGSTLKIRQLDLTEQGLMK